ncbi:MAG TPA: aminodeoxychorismate synthase component I [Nitratifractor sp.]|nr:aminodeoxychorismate synthase component I [Nitratifractor sp.]
MAIEFLGKEAGFEKINQLGQQREPFLFIISYDKSKIFAKALKELDSTIAYSLDCGSTSNIGKKDSFKKYPIDYQSYVKAFNEVIEEIKSGNSYLLNLTFKSKIETSLRLDEIFAQAKAPYKLLIEDEFVCFSPECFIKIEENRISTYPMKGTIDANIPNAKEKILNDLKESAEHTMIVDLMRNDLNMVGTKTSVPKFRYTDKIKAGEKELLQVSSHVEAQCPNNWQESIGDILDTLTPAGSITGTPKRKTIDIINSVERDSRGLYSGVFGLFNGKTLKSAVMIRAISKVNDTLYYHSGGGITIDSDPELEYQELIDKIYLPL